MCVSVSMAAYTSRDLVEDFLRYKLLSSGLRADSVPPRLRPAGSQRGPAAAASASTSSRRSERHMTSHRGVAPVESQQGEEALPWQQLMLTPTCLRVLLLMIGVDEQQL